MRKTFLGMAVMVALTVGNVRAEIASGDWRGVGKWAFNEQKQGGTGTWSISDSGVLTISGNGYINYYGNASNSPWYEYRESITAVNISEGITDIGQQVFLGLTNATSINLPETLTTIDNGAFANAENLTSLNIPASVTAIGDSAFRNLYNLTTLTFPEDSQLKTIGVQNFDYNKLESVALPQSLTNIGANIFLGSQTKNLIIPDSITSLTNTFSQSQLYHGHIYCSRAQEEMCRTYFTAWQYCGSNSSCKNHYLNDVLRIYDVDKTCDGDGNCTYNLFTINGETFTSYNDMVAALGFPVPPPKENKLVKNADGSYSVFDPDGNFIGFRGKRIYTVEEATKLSKETGNTFKLRYK